MLVHAAHADAWEELVDSRGPATAAVVVESIDDLASEWPVDRERAAELLAGMGPAGWESANALVTCAKSSEGSLRTTCLTALAELGPWAAPVMPEIAGWMDDPEPGIRLLAYRAIAGMGRTAHPLCARLAGGLSDEWPGVRMYAIRALSAACLPPSAWQLPVEAALRDPHAGVRAEAAVALLLVNRSAREPLDVLLQSLEGTSTGAAPAFADGRGIDAFRRLGPAVRPFLPAIRRKLQTPGSQPVAGLAMYVLHEDPDFAAGLDQLRRGLYDPALQVRLDCAVLALEVGVMRTTAGRVLLQTGEAPVRTRRKIVHQLCNLGERAIAGLPALLRCLESPDAWTRFYAARSISSIGAGARTSEPALRSRLQDFVPCVRHQTALALSALTNEDPAVEQVLVAALSDFSAEIRWDAVKAVSRGKMPAGAVEPLRHLAEDRNEIPEIRSAAQAAVEGVR